MNYSVSRNKLYEKELIDCINENYGLGINGLKEASRGVDGETWIAFSKNKKFFIKISYYRNHKKRFINSINTLNLLNDNGIKNINSIVKNIFNKNYVRFNKGIMAIYTFVAGQVDFKISYKVVIEHLVPIYKINSSLKKLKQEDYNIDNIFSNLDNANRLAKNDENLRKYLSKYKVLISDYCEKLKFYNSKINKQGKKFITHGDACVNIMVHNNKICLIDWDDTLVAPIERDCWFFIDYNSKIDYINKYLVKNGIDYSLSKDMLAYYAYKSALSYVNDIIEKYIETKNKELLGEIDDIFNGWVKDKILSINN